MTEEAVKNIEEHHEHRRKHKRAARRLLRGIAEDADQPMEARLKAAEILLNAPGRWRNLVGGLKDIFGLLPG